MIATLPKIISTDGNGNGECVDGSVRFTIDYHDELQVPIVRSVSNIDTHPNTILYVNDISLSTAPNDSHSNRRSGSQNNLQFIYNELI
jgi:hypothetical protein